MIKKQTPSASKQTANAESKYGNRTTNDAAWLKYYTSLNGETVTPRANTWQLGGLSNGVSTAAKRTAEEVQKLENYVAEQQPVTGTPGATGTPGTGATGAQAATGSSPLSYADYLEKYGLSQAGGAAMSYADYLERTGVNTERDYQRTVRQAETDYAKARAGYGASGETLGRAGMSASGYSDYINGAGFAAMQNAKVAAADTKALADAQHAASYADYVSGVEQNAANYNATLKQNYANYLMNEEATQKATSQELGVYVNSLAAEGADAETIKARTEAYARAMGYGLPEDIDSLINSSVSAYAKKTPTEAASEAAAAEAEAANARAGALEIVNSGTENALSGAQIRQQLKQAGYSDEIIDSVMGDYSDRVWLSLKQNVDRVTTLDEMYPEEGVGYSDKNIDTWVREGELTEAQGAELKAELADKRMSAINTALDNSMSDDETLNVINQIVTLSRAGDLSDTQVRSLMSRVGAESVQAVVDKSQKSYQGADKIGEPVVELLDQYNDVGENAGYYTEAGAEAIQEEIADSMRVSLDNDSKDGLHVAVSVSGKNGNANETLQATGIRIVSGGKHGVAYGEAPWPAQDLKDGFYTADGRLYGVIDGDIYYIDRIYEKSAGSKQNADALMEILKSKATKINTPTVPTTSQELGASVSKRYNK